MTVQIGEPSSGQSVEKMSGDPGLGGEGMKSPRQGKASQGSCPACVILLPVQHRRVAYICVTFVHNVGEYRQRVIKIFLGIFISGLSVSATLFSSGHQNHNGKTKFVVKVKFTDLFTYFRPFPEIFFHFLYNYIFSDQMAQTLKNS